MHSLKHNFVRIAFACLLLTVGFASTASAQPPGAMSTFRFFVDADPAASPTTGCTIATTLGTSLSGIDQIVTVVVNTGVTPTISTASRQECSGGIFNPASPPAPPGAAMGPVPGPPSNLSTIETSAPLAGLPTAAGVRVYFDSIYSGNNSPQNRDELLTLDGTPTGGGIIVQLIAGDIPTLSEWGLILLALLLSVSAFVVMRRRGEGGRAAAGLLLVVFALGAGVAWAAITIVVDGNPNDWTVSGITLATDANADAQPNADIVRGYGVVQVDTNSNTAVLFLRIDVRFTGGPLSNNPPVVNPATFSIAENSTNGTTVGTVTFTDDPGQTHTFAITGGNTGGAFTIDASTGEIRVANMAALDFETTPTFSLMVQVTDNGTPIQSGTATVTVNLTNVNEAPVANSDNYAVAEGGTLNPAAPGVLGNDTDPEGTALTAVLVAGPLHSSAFTLNPNGSFTYTHDGSETASDSFTYRANDGTLDSNVVTVTIAITSGNDAPMADDDSYNVDEGGTLNQPAPGVLDGDTDPEGSTLTAVLVTGPSHASSFTLNPNGSFTYVHDGSETPSSDSFTYRANDGSLDSNVATVTIAIAAVNDAPVADNDSYNVNEGGTLNQAAPGVLDGDTDADSGSLTAVLDSGPSNATSFTLNPDGSFTYVHNGSETTADSFTYHANDGSANSNVATVTIAIAPVNDAPVADDDSYNVNEGGTLNQAAPGVLDGDVDVDSGSLMAVLDSGPAHATSFTLNPDGSFTYVHDGSDTPLSDSFTYHATDGVASSNVATVTIAIAAANDPPALDLDADDSGGTTGSNYAITFTDGDAAKFIEDTADATITDSDGTTLVSLTVTLTNLLDPGFEVLDVDLTGADPAFSKNYDTTTTPGTGVLTISASPARPITEFETLLRKITYVNTDDDLDTTARIIQFVANDGTSNSNTAVTTVSMVAVNDPPTADNDSYNTTEGGTLNVPAPGVLDGDQDPEGSSLTAVLVAGPAHASSFTLNPDGSFTYVHDGSETTSDSFTYEANDGSLDSNTATVSIAINADNDAPTADNDSYNVNEGGTLNQPAPGVLDGDTDPEGSPLTAVLDSGPSHASSFTLNSDGSFTYVHDGSETPSSDSFTYHATDGTASSNVATVTIAIAAVNDAPVANNDSYNVNEGGTLNQAAPGVLTNDTDADSGTLTAVLDSGPAHASSFTLNPDGSFTYVHDGSETPLTDSFTYHATDGTASSNIATVTITIAPVNDAPVADNDSYNVNEGGTLNQAAPGVLDGDTDADSGTLMAVLDSGPAHASLFTLNADGSFTYVHNGSETLSDSFTYRATDGTASSNIATVTITIAPVNDPPVANPDTANITEEAPNVPAANTVAGNVLTNDTDPDSSLTVSAVAGGSVGSPRAGSYGSVTINSDGSYTYTLDDNNSMVNALQPGGTLTESFGYTASDGLLTSSSTLMVTIHGADDPATPDNDAHDFIGNTQLEVDRDTADTPEVIANTPVTIPDALGVLDGDVDPDGGSAITIAGIVGCGDLTAPFDCVLPGQGTVSLQEDGSFSFIPEPGDTDPTASFQYTLVGNPAPATVTLTRFERVWYVDPTAAGGGNGTSALPFNAFTALNGAGGAGDSDLVGDYIFVHDGTLAGSIELEASQRLIGEGVELSIPVSLNGNPSPTSLRLAGTKPQVTNATGNTVTVTGAVPVEIRGLSLASNNSNAIDLTAAAALSGSATLTIESNEIRNAGAEGVDINLNAGTSGTLTINFTNNTWDLAGTHNGNSFDARTAAAAANLRLNFSNNPNILSTGAGASGVFIDGSGGGTVTITGFANNSVHQNTVGNGVLITSAIFDAVAGGAINTVDGGTVSIGILSNGVGGSGMALTNVQGDLHFSTNLSIFADGGTGLGVSGTGAGMQFRVASGSAPAAVGIIEATGGPAVNASAAALDLRLTSLRSTNSASTGVSLTNITGTFSAPGGVPGSSITNAGTTDFLISGGTANVTYGGTITDDVGQLVSISGATGGIKSFEGAITDGNDGDGGGVSLSGNTGATIRFSGGLTLSTGGNPAFAATGGGTLEICDENPCNGGATGGLINRITTTTGTALNVANTTISANNLEFQSISAGTVAGSGGNGITLDNTGTAAGNGGLIVRGTGAAGSGGTIQHKTGADGSTASGIGIYLNNTKNATFNRMQLNDFDNFAIFGTGVQGFTLNSSVINGVNGNNGGFDEGAVRFDNLLVNGLIDNCTIEGGIETNIRVINNTGTLNAFVVQNSTIRNNSTTIGGDGIFARAQAGANMAVKVLNSVLHGHRDDHIATDAENSGAMTTVITGNTLTSNGTIGAPPQPSTLGGQITVTGGAAFSSTSTFNISNNIITGAVPAPITVNVTSTTSTAAGLLSGTISGNQLGQAGSANSGSSSSDGMSVIVNGAATINATITNNQIRQFNNIGIQFIKRDGSGNMNLTVTGNTIAEPVAPNALQGILVTSGATSGPPADSGTVCANIGGAGALANTVTGPNFGGDLVRVRQRFSTFVQLPGYGGGAADTTAVANYLIGRNTITNEAPNAKASASTQAPGSFLGGAACTAGAAPL